MIAARGSLLAQYVGRSTDQLCVLRPERSGGAGRWQLRRRHGHTARAGPAHHPQDQTATTSPRPWMVTTRPATTNCYPAPWWQQLFLSLVSYGTLPRHGVALRHRSRHVLMSFSYVRLHRTSNAARTTSFSYRPGMANFFFPYLNVLPRGENPHLIH